MRVAVSVGSNLGDRLFALRHAVSALEQVPEVSGVRVSSLYETDPVGGVEQPDFLNAVAVADMVGTSQESAAQELLELARGVESDLQRVREVRWGPRTVDLDVLAVGDLRSDDPELTVPHPRLAERAFVLVPWAEIDPGFAVPGLGTVSALLAELSPEQVAGVRRFGDWT